MVGPEYISSTQMNDLPDHGLWNKTASPAPETSPLEGSHRADVLVVGGGYTGLSTALHLAEMGTGVSVLEAQAIGHGGSGRNMGQVNAGFLVLPQDVKHRLGPELGESMNAAFAASADLVFELIERHSIDCDAVREGNLFVAHDRRSLDLIRAFHAQHASAGACMEWVEDDVIRSLVGSPVYTAGVLDRRSGTVQPLSYARGLAAAAVNAGASIHTQSRVTELTRKDGAWTATTESGATINAEQVVLATDSYSDSLWPGLERTLVPITAQQVATTPLSENVGRTILDGGQAASDRMRYTHYFRKDRHGRLLVVTGGPAPPAPALLKHFFPQLQQVRFEYHWSGTVGMSRDHLPQVYRPAPGVTAVLGYSGRGLSAGTMMGKLLAGHLTRSDSDTRLPVPIRELKPRRFLALRTKALAAALTTARSIDAAMMRANSRGSDHR